MTHYQAINIEVEDFVYSLHSSAMGGLWYFVFKDLVFKKYTNSTLTHAHCKKFWVMRNSQQFKWKKLTK